MAVLERIDNGAGDLLTDSRATLAAPDSALSVYPLRIHIVRAVNYDRPLPCQIIDAGFKAIHTQGIAMTAPVALTGAKQPDT